VDDVQGIAHNKTIIVDGARLITGSYNFSKAANTRNSENMLFIQDEEMAKIYRAEWYKRQVQ
jgi:phospholipase D